MGHRYNGELGALRDRLDPIVKANGWVSSKGTINSQYLTWFKSVSHLPASDIEALFHTSRFSRPKPEGLSPEIKQRRKEVWDPQVIRNGWVQTNGTSCDSAYIKLVKDNRHIPIDELEKIIMASQFWKPKPEGLSAEIKKRRIEVWDPQVKKNGWIQRNGAIYSQYGILIKDNQHLPVDELEQIILASRFWKPKPQGLPAEIKKRRKEVWDPQVKRNGWLHPNGKTVDSWFAKLITKNKLLPIDELEKIILASRFWKTNPKMYKDDEFLLKQIEPIISEVTQVFDEYAGMDFNITNAKQVRKEMTKKLSAHTDDQQLVKALADRYFKAS